MMELETRLVFIDTSAYENANYQFGEHALGKLQNFIEHGRVQLLITDVTTKEIETHLLDKSIEAAAKIKKVAKDAMFLRNAPALDCHGIFTKVSGDDIYKVIHEKFLEFVETDNVEIISISSINPSIIFNAYFNKLPPFANTGKKYEFPDAFVLEAIKKVSIDRNTDIYIVSSDNDMKSFCDIEDNKLIYLESINALIDRILRSNTVYDEPIKFADEVFDSLEGEIKERAIKALNNSEFIYEELDDFEDVINSTKVKSISIVNKELQNVDERSAEYIVEFEVKIIAEYIIADYNRSPWDHEDKKYVFVLNNKETVLHTQRYRAVLMLSYENSLKIRAHVDDLFFEENYFDLTLEGSKRISYRELDVNGD